MMIDMSYDFYNFEAPYSHNGLWVEDRRGQSVCECPSPKIAYALTNHLNAMVKMKQNMASSSWNGHVDRQGGSFDQSDYNRDGWGYQP